MALGDYINTMVNGAKRAAAAVMPGDTAPVSTDTPLPTLNTAPASAGPTAQTARAAGGMSPEAAAFKASQTAAPAAAPIASAAEVAPGLLSKIGSAMKLTGRVGGAVTGGLMAASDAQDVAKNGPNLDNVSNFVGSTTMAAAPFVAGAAIPATVGALSFGLGKKLGHALVPDNVAVPLARAWNGATGQGSGDGTATGSGANTAELAKATAVPGSNAAAAAARWNGDKLRPLAADQISDQGSAAPATAPTSQAPAPAPQPAQRWALPNQNDVFSDGANAQQNLPDGIGMIRNNQTGSTTLLNRGLASKLSTGANGQLSAGGRTSVSLPNSYAAGNGDNESQLPSTMANGQPRPGVSGGLAAVTGNLGASGSAGGYDPQNGSGLAAQIYNRLLGQDTGNWASRPGAHQSAVSQVGSAPTFDPSQPDTAEVIAARYGAARGYANRMAMAQNQDAYELAHSNQDVQVAHDHDQLAQTGLLKAADLYDQEQNRGFNRSMQMNQIGYQRTQDNEKRFNDALTARYGDVLNKDGTPNPARAKAETAVQANMANNGRTKGAYTPDQQNLLMNAVDLPGYNPSPSTLDSLKQIPFGNPAVEKDPLIASTNKGALDGVVKRGPAGIGQYDANGSFKFDADMGDGGLISGGSADIQRARARQKAEYDAELAQAQARKQRRGMSNAYPVLGR